MKSVTCYLFIFFLLTVLASARLGAQEAHAHGLATLTLALENGLLEIQLESPAANLVGFERKARSPKEKKAVTQIEMILKEPTSLFSFNGTNCQPKKTRIDVSGIVDAEHEEKEKHSKDEHHAHSKEHDESDHSEINAEYRFSCKNPERLASVSVALMEQFPGIEKITVMWITETKQGAVSLTPNNNAILFR